MKILPWLVATTAAFALTATLAPSAHACWDGYRAGVREVSLSVGGDATWRPETARALARWGTRIDALLPEGAMLDVEFGSVTVCRGGEGGYCGDRATMLAETKWEGSALSALFTKVAAATHASPSTVRRAMTLDAAPLTVQVFSARTEAQAEKVAARINEGEWEEHGFYVAGGFPAKNPTAHVMRGSDALGKTVYRVVVGAFLDRNGAETARAELKKVAGVDGFTRPL